MYDHPQIDALAKKGITIVRFAEHHFRFNDRLDLFPSDRREGWKWHDTKTGERGVVLRFNVTDFVRKYLNERPVEVETEECDEGEPDPNTFKGKLFVLVIDGAPWKEVWSLVSAEMERVKHGQTASNQQHD